MHRHKTVKEIVITFVQLYCVALCGRLCNCGSWRSVDFGAVCVVNICA